MSCYKYLLDEIEQLREILSDTQNNLDTLTEHLEYGPDFVNKDDVIQHLGYIDLPPCND